VSTKWVVNCRKGYKSEEGDQFSERGSPAQRCKLAGVYVRVRTVM
jgi:hypothetical protein